LIIPQRRKDPSTILCEARSVRICAGICNETALVAICLVETVGGDEVTGFLDGAVGVLAAVKSVEGVAVVGSKVDVFNNIDFAVVGPVGTLSPEGGPDGAL
jgi:hypothetical protein